MSTAAFQQFLLEQPEAGNVIKGSGGVRKVRWTRAGSGKSGGVRVCYYARNATGQILLLVIYAKSVRASISGAVLKKLEGATRMITNEQLLARDANRNIGAELLAAVQELQAGQGSRTTRFESLADGSVRRTVSLADGAVQSQEVLSGPKWQLLAARSQAGLSQSQFARVTGVSVRTLQEWEQGRKVPSGAAQSLLKLVSRHPHLLAELA